MGNAETKKFLTNLKSEIFTYTVGYSEETVRAANRLIDDLNIAPLWGQAFSVDDFREAIHCYELSTKRNEFHKKTQKEQEVWSKEFEQTVEKMKSLMLQAPTPPSDWGFPVRDNALMNVLYRIGYKIPPYGTDEYWYEMLKAEIHADAEKFTLIDAINHYVLQQKSTQSADFLSVSRPKDEKAARHIFIVNMCTLTSCTTSTIAKVGASMFCDENFDDRLVRRLKPRR